MAVYRIFGLVLGDDTLFANTILWRLADAFRLGEKQTGLSIVRIFSSEMKHCDKRKHKLCKGPLSKVRASNHLELLERVKTVFDGCDSKSRALALVLFGCWADFNAQMRRYLILSGLGSTHAWRNGVELVLNSSDEGFLVAMLFSLLKLVPISTLLTSEQIMCIFPTSPNVDLHVFVKLLAFAENAIQYPVLRKSCLVIRILVELSCEITERTDIENGACSSSSLPSWVISLIKDRISPLVMSLLDACQIDSKLFQDLQSLLKNLLSIVGKHLYLGVLVVDNINIVTDYIVTITTKGQEALSDHVAVNFTGGKHRTII